MDQPDRYLLFDDHQIRDLNSKGLGKLLFIRREAIYLKNIMRQAARNRSAVEAMLAELEIDWPDYLGHLSNRLRRVLKVRRELPHLAGMEGLKLLRSGDPLSLLMEIPVRFLALYDFDRTITCRKFQPMARSLQQRNLGIGQFWICSAHGDQEVIARYLRKIDLPIRRSRVRAMGGVEAKKRFLFERARSSDRPLMLYFDDERPLCEMALMLGYHAYTVASRVGHPLRRVGFDHSAAR